MRFSIACNWDEKLIDVISGAEIKETFGKLRSDVVGGGRSSYSTADISRKYAASYIKRLEERGISFNYLLNACCTDNVEFTSGGQKRIRELLDWLATTETKSVTVTNPFLFETIKEHYPGFQLMVSTWAGIDSVEKARFWDRMGAKRITLPALRAIRDFPFMRAVRKAVKCEIQVIANDNCLHECPLEFYHKTTLSHASQSQHSSGGFFIDYCSHVCKEMRLKDPSYWIRSGWIRPEDLRHYADAGIDVIKLVDREMTTEQLKLVAGAYTRGRYDGNLLDLFMPIIKTRESKRRFPAYDMFRYFFKPTRVNVFRLYGLKDKATAVPVRIDNRKLDGFIDHFLEGGCSLRSCDDCRYCMEVAKKAVEVNAKDSGESLEKNRDVLDEMVSGRLFRYR